MNAIETVNLTKVYKNFTAVNSLNLKIPDKTIFGMLGPNGAGKTTTIKMLTCLIQPTSGGATVGGYDIQKNPNEVRRLLGMVPQQVSLYKDNSYADAPAVNGTQTETRPWAVIRVRCGNEGAAW